MSKPIVYQDPQCNQLFKRIHGPCDQWSKSDRIMLTSSLALSALLISAGVLGVLAHLGHDMGRFQAIASKFDMPTCALGASSGAGILLLTVATGSVKAYSDYKEKKNIQSILEKGCQADGSEATHMKLQPVVSPEAFTIGTIRNYHILYHKDEVHLFATDAAVCKKARSLQRKGLQGFRTTLPAYTERKDSIMGDEIKYSVREKVTHETPWGSKYTEWVSIDHTAPIRDRVVKDRLRLGFGMTLFALSVAAAVVPIFYQFKFCQTVQAFGVSSSTLLVAGAFSGILLRAQSDEFVTKGHDEYYRKVSYGVSYGISRTAFAALFMSLAIAGAYYRLAQSHAINPLLIAPPLACATLALVAYSFFKGKAHEKRWNEGCNVDLYKEYDDGDNASELDRTDENDSYRTFRNGKRYVLSSHKGEYKRLVIDLADIEEREAFEGAKLQYNIAATLLPLLALVCVVSLVGTSFFLRRFPLPIA